MKELTKENSFIQLSKKIGNTIYYSVFDEKTNELWIDTKGLPNDAILCCIVDGQPMRIIHVGKRNQARRFLNMEWLINGWGTSKSNVEILKINKESLLENVKKYLCSVE